MTQEQALIEAQKMFPGNLVSVSRDRFIGSSTRNQYYVWKRAYEGQSGAGSIMGSAYESWESALIEARVKGERILSPDVPFEDETEDTELESI